MTAKTLPLNRRLFPAILVATFVVSRAAAFALGLRYSTVELVWFWQVLDLDVLHHHLSRGLINLHGQPPLYNALIGVALKLAGDAFGVVLVSLQLLLGLAAALAIYFTLLRLRIQPFISLCIALVLALNPTAILCEFDALYTEFVYSGLCLLVFALTVYVQTRAQRWLWATLAIGLSLTLIRATYQWIWLTVLCALLFLCLPAARRRTLRISVVVVVLSLLWPLKNLVLFQHFTSSTWVSYSVAKHWNATDALVAGWAKAGQLPTFTYSEAEGAERETEWLQGRWRAPRSGAPELDELTKFAGGPANWNSLALLNMHNAQAKDVSFLLRHYPGPIFTEAIKSVGLYFEPTSRYFLISQNEAAAEYHHLSPIIHALDRTCCNLFGLPPDFRVDYRPATQADVKDHSTPIHLVQRLCISAVIGMLLFLAALVSLASKTFWSRDPDRRILIILLSWSVVWVFVVTNLVETGENMRFRFETQALAVVVIALFLQQLWTLKQRRSTDLRAI
jgi:hypothetical protein